jgi:uncharacterized protein YdeI (YjbR/CyaY-like superfamily)
MNITDTIKPNTRAEWRAWLETHHHERAEVWLLFADTPDAAKVAYLDTVEEAICFGWIDGIQKRFTIDELAQRFTPRKRRSNWTELNKERARRLIRLGQMAPAGHAALPVLDAEFATADDIVATLKAVPNAWPNFVNFPDLYRRIRIGYIEEMRKNPAEFDRRLRNFVTKTADNKQFGNWNDNGRLL